jgi:hypothetical protein
MAHVHRRRHQFHRDLAGGNRGERSEDLADMEWVQHFETVNREPGIVGIGTLQQRPGREDRVEGDTRCRLQHSQRIGFECERQGSRRGVAQHRTTRGAESGLATPVAGDSQFFNRRDTPDHADRD